MIHTRLVDTLSRVSEDLRSIGVRWALVGGFAVAARSEPRTTRDIDIAVAVEGDHQAEELIVRLRNRGYSLETVMEHRDVPRLATARLLRRATDEGTLIDLLFATAGIEPEVVEAADTLEVFPGLSLPLAKTGHLLALKILAFRPDRFNERWQDLFDIRELLRVADDEEIERARQGVRMIADRGFDRGKDIAGELETKIVEFQRYLESPSS